MIESVLKSLFEKSDQLNLAMRGQRPQNGPL